MLLKYAKKPEYFLDIEKNKVIEVYDFLNQEKIPLFKLGESRIGFDNFTLEVQRIENKLENIFLTFYDVDADKIAKLAEYYQITDNEKFNIKDIKKATVLFSVDKDAIEEGLQPQYESPESSKKLFNFTDANKESILFNLDCYLIEGVINN